MKKLTCFIASRLFYSFLLYISIVEFPQIDNKSCGNKFKDYEEIFIDKQDVRNTTISLEHDVVFDKDKRLFSKF